MQTQGNFYSKATESIFREKSSKPRFCHVFHVTHANQKNVFEPIIVITQSVIIITHPSK